MIENITVEGVFINLVRSVINNEKSEALPEGVTADELYEISIKQKMVPMILCALNMIRPKPASDNWGKYLSLFSAGCLNSEVQMYEYHKLVEYLCRNGVKIIPLKGCVINGLYPSVGLRTMSDVDLLYSGVSTKDLAKLMKAVGYKAESLGMGSHDVFSKEGNISIELHRKLVFDYSPYRPVLENMFDKAVADENIPNLYHMKPEDLYIHVIVHAAKHFEGSGLGVRPLVDIYLLNQKYKDCWNFDYISKQLNSVGLKRFEEKLNSISYAFFGDSMMEVSEEDIDFFFRAGLYGIHHDPAWNYMGTGKTNKLKFFLHRTFYPYSGMCEVFPILKKFPILLPFAWLYRIIDVLLHRRENLISVATAKCSKEDSGYAMKMLNNFGLRE